MQLIQFWQYFGCLHLVILSIMDIWKKGWVDDRHNWMMSGITITLYTIQRRPLWYILVTIALIIGLNYGLKKFKVLGEADVNTISWIFIGYMIINSDLLVGFFLIWGFTTLAYFILKRYIFRIKTPVPYYTVLLISFAANGFFNKLFDYP